MRQVAGVVLSRFATTNPDDAAAKIEQLIGETSGCSPELDAWFGMLGNAGLPATKPMLLSCVAPQIPATRRAAGAGALRRIPGEDVTRTLIRLAIDDGDEQVRVACLRGLVSRNVEDAELAPFVSAQTDEWSPASLNLLLDVIDNVVAFGLGSGSASTLLERLSRSTHSELAGRARQRLDASR
jgi:hypothetical protein